MFQLRSSSVDSFRWPLILKVFNCGQPLITSEPAHDFEAACTSKFSYSSEILQVHEALSEKGGNDRLKVRVAR